mmetsp:Transcript_809/g.3155  ORF Transcript_809/g.3155 Transcript_809/m.3155 type:complete len:309 (-) Transcript_809:902-1828(-)
MMFVILSRHTETHADDYRRDYMRISSRRVRLANRLSPLLVRPPRLEHRRRERSEQAQARRRGERGDVVSGGVVEHAGGGGRGEAGDAPRRVHFPVRAREVPGADSSAHLRGHRRAYCAVGERRERQRALRGGHGVCRERRPRQGGRGEQRRGAQHFRRSPLFAVAQISAGDSAERRAEAHDADSRGGDPDGGAVRVQKRRGVRDDHQPRADPQAKRTPQRDHRGLELRVARGFRVAQRDPLQTPRLRQRRIVPSPRAERHVQGKRAGEHQHAHRAHRAADVGDVQQVPHDGREEKRAGGARRGDDAHR